MPKTIMGLNTRACINGLDKVDFENVKKITTLETETDEIKNETIPSLDDRITALEQGGSSGSEWQELDVSTYNKANALLNTWFTTDGDHYFAKKDMMIWYNNNVYYANKDSNIQNDIIRFVKFNTTNTYINILDNNFSLTNIFVNSTSQGQSYFNYNENVIKINRTDSTITYESSYYYTNRSYIRVFVKNS